MSCTENADGSATISGTTEPGASVVITDPNGNNVPVTVAADGTITGTIAAPAEAGDYEGTATDVNGNDSTDTATATILPPDAPIISLADDTGEDISDGITIDATVNVGGIVAGNTWQYSTALLHKDLKCKAPLIEPNLMRNLGKWST